MKWKRRVCSANGVIVLLDMPTVYELSCPPIRIRVYWQEEIEGPPKQPPGWVAGVSLLNEKRKSSPQPHPPKNAKDAVIALAKDLCKRNKVAVPASLDAPQWKAR